MSRLESQPNNPAASGPVATRFPLEFLMAASLGLLTIFLYWPAINNGFTNYDDPDYVTANPQVQAGLSLAGVKWALATGAAGNWHPLTWLSLMLDVTLFGRRAAGLHFTSVLWHAANVVLIFWLFRCLTGARWRSAGVAALFAWHPLHVESVAWISERKDVLSTFFGFLTLLFYARYVRAKGVGSQQSEVRALSLSVGALICFACGLMSKPMLVTWPFVLLLLDYWPLGRIPPLQPSAFSPLPSVSWWPLIREKIPFFALAIAASVATFVAQQHGGAVATVASVPLGERGENALISYNRYLGKIFWPSDLAIFYPRPAHWPWEPALAAGIGLAGISVLAWGWRRRYPWFLTGWLWYGGTLVPVIGLVQVGAQAMADRYTYIPSVGIFIVVVWGAGELVKRGGHWPGRRITLCAVGMFFATALVLCLPLTRRQIGYWQNSETLFQRAVAVTQNNFIAHLNLGLALAEDGKVDEAIIQYREALKVRTDDADTHCDLGVALTRQNHLTEAIREYREALRLQPRNARTHDDLGLALNTEGETSAAISEFQAAIELQPNFGPAHYDLGVVLSQQGQTDAAINQFQTAIQIDPANAQTHHNLGDALVKKGMTDAAMAEFQEAIRLQPNDADAYNNWGNLLAKMGQADAAINELQQAVRLKPADADTHYNLGNLLLRTRRVDEAIRELKAAVDGRPQFAPAHYNLAVALNKQGEAEAAISEFREATRWQPDYAIAHNSLGIALAAQGRIDDAITEFQAALRIKPDYANAKNNLSKAQALKGK